MAFKAVNNFIVITGNSTVSLTIEAAGVQGTIEYGVIELTGSFQTLNAILVDSGAGTTTYIRGKANQGAASAIQTSLIVFNLGGLKIPFNNGITWHLISQNIGDVGQMLFHLGYDVP